MATIREYFEKGPDFGEPIFTLLTTCETFGTFRTFEIL